MTTSYLQQDGTYKMNIAEFPIKKLLDMVSELLDSMVQTNNQIPNSQITYFHSRAVPNISILSYLTRIYKFAPFSNEALLSMLIYFDRITKLDNGFTINSYNIHRLLITSVVIASKFTSDIFYANNRYAKVGGIPLFELNQLELELLFLIDFQLHITLEDLQAYADQLLSHAMSLAPKPLSEPAPEIVHTTTTTNKIKFTSKNPTINNTTTTCNNPIVLPLTPPYTSSPSTTSTTTTTTTTDHRTVIAKHNDVHRHHPYKRPGRKECLGLVSPKD